jgi:FKBP-type peptidyl-prolyl cis-trans isomerase (trigger factor)
MLYDFFKVELERKKREYGEVDLKENVNTLMKLNEKLKEDCVLDVVDETANLSVDFGPWSRDVQGFKINEDKTQCKYFGIGENQFIEYLTKLQIKRFSLWKKGN